MLQLFFLVLFLLPKTPGAYNPSWNRLLLEAETKDLHEKYEAAFNHGDLGAVMKVYDAKSALFLLNGTKVTGTEGISIGVKDLMSSSSKIHIDPEFHVFQRKGIFEFYVLGKFSRINETGQEETIFYKQRIIRRQKTPFETELRLWSEHWSKEKIDPPTVPEH